MAAKLGFDAGYTLWAQCDQCQSQIMAFGEEGKDGRADLETILTTEGWTHLGGDGWLCEKCAPEKYVN
jgi:hypothetical protein